MTSRTTWKNLETVVAAAWTKAIGLLCKRNPLSGANNRDDRGGLRPGDVVIHSDFHADCLIECKYRSSHAHHTLYREAKADAKKHGLSHALLYTKVKNEEGYLVVFDAALFHTMLEIKDVQRLLQLDAEKTDTLTDGRGRRPISSQRKSTLGDAADDQSRDR